VVALAACLATTQSALASFRSDAIGLLLGRLLPSYRRTAGRGECPNSGQRLAWREAWRSRRRICWRGTKSPA